MSVGSVPPSEGDSRVKTSRDAVAWYQTKDQRKNTSAFAQELATAYGDATPANALEGELGQSEPGPDRGAREPSAATPDDVAAASLALDEDAGAPTRLPDIVDEPIAAEPTVSISSFDDDPFAQPSVTEQIPLSAFQLGADGLPIGLQGPRVGIFETGTLASVDQNFNFTPFANNPFSAAQPDAAGNFLFPDEARFPSLDMAVDGNGNPVTDANGLQVWTPRDLHLGQTTAFEGAYQALTLSEQWSGRTIGWGQGGQLSINPHEFIDANAFFNPADRGLHFGVVPYQDQASGEVRLFELSSSWEVVAHEAGHAIHNELKPNALPVQDAFNGFGQFGESFGDQLAMWSSLKDPERVAGIIEQSGGDLRNPNALARTGEGMGVLIGSGDSLRDALNDLRVSDTTPEVHDRAQPFTGATYQVFTGVVDRLQAADESLSQADAMAQAGDIMGQFLTRSQDYSPENVLSLEDYGKAYLKVDKEHFGGKYQDLLVAEFERREIFDSQSLGEWQQHESRVPQLTFPAEGDLQGFVNDHLSELNVPSGFGLDVQTVTTDSEGRNLVRVQLTGPPGSQETFLNAGVLAFREDGSLADYHGAIDPQVELGGLDALVSRAREQGLADKGPLAIVQSERGETTVAAYQEVDDSTGPHTLRFTLENPQGERLPHSFAHPSRYGGELLARLLPPGAEPLTATQLTALGG